MHWQACAFLQTTRGNIYQKQFSNPITLYYITQYQTLVKVSNQYTLLLYN